MLTTSRPELLLLDLRMPEMDGISLLHVLRNYLRWSTLPVVVVTAIQQGPELERVKDFGIRGIFIKGRFRLEELVTAVKEHLPIREGAFDGRNQGA